MNQSSLYKAKKGVTTIDNKEDLFVKQFQDVTKDSFHLNLENW